MSNFVDAPVLSRDVHRVSLYKDQGGRHHMEDEPVFVRNNYEGVPEGISVEPYDYIAIFDGHGGSQASEYASKHLLQDIICQAEFWSADDADIQAAIRKGFIDCHYKMWKASKDWPPSSPGIICTAGTTASVAFVRRGKVYVGHVGDSGIALGRLNSTPVPPKAVNGNGTLANGYNGSSPPNGATKRQEPFRGPDTRFETVMLTKDHKPESPEERERIESLGGEVRCKSGVYRVVWKRPITSLSGQILYPGVICPVNPVPFLAVARSLGDFWSYEQEKEEFTVSPVPDVAVHTFPLSKHCCLIAGSDGLWNVIRPQECVDIVEETYRMQELWMWQCLRAGKPEKIQAADVNVAELLVRKVLNRCELRKMRSDNVGIVIYYPQPSEEKIQKLMSQAAERPDLTSLYPWIEDPDVGVAQYRHSLLHLQNMVSCIGQSKILMSALEISYRIDMIGFTPRMRSNPLRDAGTVAKQQNGHANNGKDIPFDVDPFSPRCAVVLTRGDETVRVPAYESLVTDEALGGNGTLTTLNPLRRRTTDVLLSQRIKFLRTHSSNNVTEANGGAGLDESAVLSNISDCLNGHKRMKTVADLFDTSPTENGTDHTPSPTNFLSLPLSCAREDLDQISRMESYAPF